MMSELKSKIHDEANNIDYILVGDYYIPVIELPEMMTVPLGNGGDAPGIPGKNKSTSAQPPDFDGQVAQLSRRLG